MDQLVYTPRKIDDLALSRQLWLWEWHAFVLWAIFAAIAIPVIALALTPFLRRLLKRVERHQYPILSSSPQASTQAENSPH